MTEAEGTTAGLAGVVGWAGLAAGAWVAAELAGAEVEAGAAGVLVPVLEWVRPTAARATRAAAMMVPMAMAAMR